jgi:hypothetical protein
LADVLLLYLCSGSTPVFHRLTAKISLAQRCLLLPHAVWRRWYREVMLAATTLTNFVPAIIFFGSAVYEAKQW